MEPKISAYDLSDYDYSNFWKDRKYEHSVEIQVLNKIWGQSEPISIFIDLGGSYGRLFPTYENISKQQIIVDYSMIGLKKAQSLWGNKASLKLIAANIYHLPFKNNSINAGQMIRVLHHIEEQDTAINEIFRVLTAKSKFVLEIPNKLHIKNRIKALFNRKFRDYINQEVSRIPSDGTKEGLKEGQTGVFLGYKPNFVYQLLKRHGLDITKKTGASYFRQGFFKKHFSHKILLSFEKIIQLLPFHEFAPSIFLQLLKKESETNPLAPITIDDILICPKCGGEINIDTENKKLICINEECKEEFPIIDGIYDLRYPKIDKLNV